MLNKFRTLIIFIASITLFIIALFPTHSVDARITLFALSLVVLMLSTWIYRSRQKAGEEVNIKEFRLYMIILNFTFLLAVTDVIMYGMYFI